jgi:hypothetical protein
MLDGPGINHEKCEIKGRREFASGEYAPRIAEREQRTCLMALGHRKPLNDRNRSWGKGNKSDCR